MPQLWACADGQLQSGSGNLDPDRDLPEEREVSTTAQDSISQPWISDRGRGVCGLSPSSSHACLVEFHPHPPRSPSQKPRSLSRVSVLTRVSTPLATTSQTVCNSSLIPSGPLITAPHPPHRPQAALYPCPGPCPKPSPSFPPRASRSRDTRFGTQDCASFREALSDPGLPPPHPPHPDAPTLLCFSPEHR